MAPVQPGLWPPHAETELLVTPHDKDQNDVPAATAVWFFDGAPPMDFLRERIAAILRSNPWLAARYVVAEGPRGGKSCKRWLHPAELPAVSAQLLGRHLREGVEDLSGARAETSYLVLNKTLTAYGCLPAAELLKKHNANKPCFIVSAVLDSNTPGKFALVVSVNHTLADGETMYNLAGMLNPSTAVTRMQPERLPGLAAVQERVLGKSEKAVFSGNVYSGNAGLGCGIVGAVLGDAWRGQNRDVLMFEVDDTWLQKRKKVELSK